MGEIDKRTAVATHQLHDTDAVLCTLSLDMSSVDGPLGLLHGSVKSERLVDHLHARAVQDEEAMIRDENDVLLFFFQRTQLEEQKIPRCHYRWSLGRRPQHI
jgi:hypothetical protein